MRVGVVRRVDVELKPPSIDNRTQAVEVTSIKIHREAPSFELTFRNASGKHIRAVELTEMRGWRRKGPPPNFDWRGMAAIRPGESWKVGLEFGWNSKAGEAGHMPEPPDRVVINSVLFTDGTYEGDSTFAASAEAYKSGRRAQLTRVLDTIREAGEWPGADPRVFARHLGTLVLQLDCTADWAAVVELAGRYPSLPYGGLEELKKSIEAGMSAQRGAVLNELRTYASAPDGEGYQAVTRAELKSLRERYEKWLAGI